MSVDPATQGNELLDNAIAVYYTLIQDKDNDIALQRAKNRIATVLQKDAGDPSALIAKGILQAAQDDVTAVDTVEAAVSRVPHLPEARLNYITALVHFGFFDRALSQARYAWDLSEGHSGILKRLIRYSLINGRIADTERWIAQWERQWPGTLAPYHDQVELMRQALAEHPDADSAALGQALSLATELARERGFAPHVSGFEVHQDDESYWLSIPVGVKADTSTLVDLELELTDRLAHTDLPARLANLAIVEFVDRNDVGLDFAA